MRSAVLLILLAGCSSPDVSALESRVADLEAKLAAREIECDRLVVGNVRIEPAGIAIATPDCLASYSHRGVVVMRSADESVASLVYSPDNNTSSLILGQSTTPSAAIFANNERSQIELLGGKGTSHAIALTTTAKNQAGFKVANGNTPLWAAGVTADGQVVAGASR